MKQVGIVILMSVMASAAAPAAPARQSGVTLATGKSLDQFGGCFVQAQDRVIPPLRFVEQAYPVCWWKAEHGVNRRPAKALGLL